MSNFTLHTNHVQGVVFGPRGKFKYMVELVYSSDKSDYDDWDLGAQALAALARATDLKVSGVGFRELPKGYILVVMEPYSMNSFPIMVTRPWRDHVPVEIAEAIEQEEKD